MRFKKLVLMMMAAVMFFSAVPAKTADAAGKMAGGGATKKELQMEKKGKSTQKASYTKRDVKLLASIIYCEAGDQSQAGMVAVGCVVMNRKKSKSFPNTIEGVIRQTGQFSPVAEGKFRRELRNYRNGLYKSGDRKTCVKAAKIALAGRDYVKVRGKKINMRKYHFFSMRLSSPKLRIGCHDFK